MNNSENLPPIHNEHIGFLRLAWPIFIENALYILVVFVDSLILSHISNEAAASVGACMFIVGFAVTLLQAFAQSASISISHRIGAKRFHELEGVSTAAVAINVLIGIIVSIIIFILSAKIPIWLGLQANVANMARIFLSIVCGTTFIQSFILAVSYILKAHEYSRQSMNTAILVNIVNAALAWSVVHGYFGLPKMGVAGVACSTLIARSIGSLFLIYLWKKHLPYRFQFRKIPNLIRTHLLETLRFGIPISLEPLMYQGSQIVITGIIARIGSEALAVRTYVWSVANFNIVFVLAFAQAAQIILGRLYGAKKYKELEKEFHYEFFTAIACTVIMVTIIFLSGHLLLKMFTNDPSIIHIGVILLGIGYILELGRTSNIITGATLRAIGDPKFPLYVGIIFMWGLCVPSAWFFGIHLNLGIIGVWFGLAADEIMRGICNFFRFRQKKWAK